MYMYYVYTCSSVCVCVLLPHIIEPKRVILTLYMYMYYVYTCSSVCVCVLLPHIIEPKRVTLLCTCSSVYMYVLLGNTSHYRASH